MLIDRLILEQLKIHAQATFKITSLQVLLSTLANANLK